MAREISIIQQAIIDSLVAKGADAGEVINPAEWSDYDYRQLLTYADAVGIATLEQLWDAFRVNVEAEVAIASPQTGAWIQAQMYKFQFDASTPQIVQFDATYFAPAFPTVDTTKQIIKYCTAVPGIYGTYKVLVAAQVDGLPVDLDTTYPGSLAAAQSYANLLDAPGITVNVITGDSDKLSIEADIYFQGGYSAVISPTTIAAIQTYLRTIPFNGVVLLSNVELAVKALPGVNDIVFRNVQARADGTAYGSGTNLVLGGTTVARKWNTVAGYIEAETTTGHTLADTLNFIAE